ncbi:hypothetical protein DFH08DRAFT_817515 [Mycena albidolilacea]|uniref:Uncharacterized protein n=1 Tax=Mycena albidolilacea TaxID=1033008 RepID=A0AAD6ZIM1_9AGAR|nr:hypothetical protein DFH08DRAFT_817515 [Mycena albidolilacea]
MPSCVRDVLEPLNCGSLAWNPKYSWNSGSAEGGETTSKILIAVDKGRFARHEKVLNLQIPRTEKQRKHDRESVDSVERREVGIEVNGDRATGSQGSGGGDRGNDSEIGQQHKDVDLQLCLGLGDGWRKQGEAVRRASASTQLISQCSLLPPQYSTATAFPTFGLKQRNGELVRLDEKFWLRLNKCDLKYTYSNETEMIASPLRFIGELDPHHASVLRLHPNTRSSVLSTTTHTAPQPPRRQARHQDSRALLQILRCLESPHISVNTAVDRHSTRAWKRAENKCPDQ